MDMLLEPKGLLDTHWIKRESKFVEQSLIQWKYLPSKDATWEDTCEINEYFITTHFEDKVVVNRGGIDKPQKSLRVPIIVMGSHFDAHLGPCGT